MLHFWSSLCVSPLMPGHTISQVILPMGILETNAQFLTKSGGSGSAVHWRSWIEIYVPLLYLSVWAANGADSRRVWVLGELGNNVNLTFEELRLVLLLAEWTSLVMRPTISEQMLQRVKGLTVEWQGLALRLHPMLQGLPNMHFIRHIGQDIRRFDPVYCVWNFTCKHINKLLKNMNQNRQFGMEISLLRAFLDIGNLQPLLARMESTAETDLERVTVLKMKTLFAKIAKSKRKASEKVSEVETSKAKKVSKDKEVVDDAITARPNLMCFFNTVEGCASL